MGNIVSISRCFYPHVKLDLFFRQHDHTVSKVEGNRGILIVVFPGEPFHCILAKKTRRIVADFWEREED